MVSQPTTEMNGFIKMLNPKEQRKIGKGYKEQVGKAENIKQDDRFKPNHINNQIKCK